jgi:hypothetical protein
MANITIKMKDGTVRKFPHQGRPGGSYTKSVRYEPGFVVVIDEYRKETAIPAADISQVDYDPEIRSW